MDLKGIADTRRQEGGQTSACDREERESKLSGVGVEWDVGCKKLAGFTRKTRKTMGGEKKKGKQNAECAMIWPHGQIR